MTNYNVDELYKKAYRQGRSAILNNKKRLHDSEIDENYFRQFAKRRYDDYVDNSNRLLNAAQKYKSEISRVNYEREAERVIDWLKSKPDLNGSMQKMWGENMIKEAIDKSFRREEHYRLISNYLVQFQNYQ